MDKSRVVKQVVSVFVLTCVFLSCTGTILLTATLWDMSSRAAKSGVIVSLVLISYASIHGVLAYGFGNLRPWAYKPTKYLVRLNGITVFGDLPKKIESREIRSLFKDETLNNG